MQVAPCNNHTRYAVNSDKVKKGSDNNIHNNNNDKIGEGCYDDNDEDSGMDLLT